jgi:hypothetical protein
MICYAAEFHDPRQSEPPMFACDGCGDQDYMTTEGQSRCDSCCARDEMEEKLQAQVWAKEVVA